MSVSDSPIIVDSDALIALVNVDDALAPDAMRMVEQVRNTKATLVYPATTIAETVTTFQRKLNRPDLAHALVASVQAHQFIIEPIDRDILTQAAQHYSPQGSKQDTFFDAIVAAVARKLNATTIFSFDKWYAKQGFTIIPNLYSVQGRI
jgi:predicted nucleic acid-binding protein